jgi:DNA-binding response OmpR family regulator
MDARMNGHGVSRRSATGGCPQRIFVAEDDEPTRDAIVTALVEEGDDVIGVECGAELAECLRIISRDSLRAPDLIAMDVCMPGHSGIEILEGLRSAGWTTPVVLMTGFASDELRSRARLAGSAVVIEKPFDVRELRSAALREGGLAEGRMY